MQRSNKYLGAGMETCPCPTRDRRNPFMSAPIRIPAFKHLWRILAISSALISVYATVLVRLGRDWWTDENYSHGLLIPFVIAYIVWSQRERFARVAQKPATIMGLTAVLAALLALWAG